MCHNGKIINLAAAESGNAPPAGSDDKRVSKFVVIDNKGELQLVYGPLGDYTYHAGLVERYCEVFDIPSGWIEKPHLYEIYGGACRIKGGGLMEERPDQKLVIFSGFSTAYGGFDRKDILYLLQTADTFAGCRAVFSR
jgi:hypothetical protein